MNLPWAPLALLTLSLSLQEPARPLLAHHTYGQGPESVLVLHSWMGNARSFDETKPHLDPTRFTYVFADLRGYGDSKHLTGEYSSTEAALDAFHLADHLDWNRFHVVGHSMSGMIVQRMMLLDAQADAHRLKSAVATNPVPATGYPADEETRAFLWSVIHNLGGTMQGVHALTGGRLGGRWAEKMARANLESSTKEAMKGYYAMWLDEDFADSLARVRPATPLRVIGGRQDLPGFQEQSLRATIGKWIPQAEFRFITDAGHFPMKETPVYFAALVEGFLTEHSTR